MRGHKFYCRSTMLGMVVPIHADSEDERERQARARQEYEERERAKREREEEERRRWSSKAHAVAQCQLAGDVVKGDVQHAGEYLKIIAPKRRNEISQALRHNLDLLAKVWLRLLAP